jgi:hypothetical protein
MDSLTRRRGAAPHTLSATSQTALACREAHRMADRRVYPRQRIVLRVDYVDAHGRAWWRITRNLSRGGLCLAYPAGLTVGDRITLTVVLPTGQPYRSQAYVVHLQPVSAGLRFVEAISRQGISCDGIMDHLDT